jgi:hypothetical protein
MITDGYRQGKRTYPDKPAAGQPGTLGEQLALARGGGRNQASPPPDGGARDAGRNGVAGDTAAGAVPQDDDQHARQKGNGAAAGQAGERTDAGTGGAAEVSAVQQMAVIRRMSDITPQAIDWIWDKWIARGAVALLDGDPGLGKSTLALDLAARVTRGWAMPPGSGPEQVRVPADVLLLSAEDDAARTIRPRLEAAGADLTRVHLLDAVRDEEGDERPPVLPWDLGLIEELIVAHDVALVIVDPFMGHLDGRIDAHRDQDVRRCLRRLRDVAERTEATILIIRHLNKMVNMDVALYRGGGSIGITGACRSALLVGRDPADASRRVLAPTKCNLGLMPRALTYTLEPAGAVAKIGWGEECDLSADDILVQPGGRKQSAGEQCAAAIRAYLAAGAKPSADMDAALRAMGYGRPAIRDGRQRAGVRVRPQGFGLPWLAELPPSSDQTTDEQTASSEDEDAVVL